MIITNKNSIHTIDYKKGISEIVEHFMTTASNNDFMIYYNCPLDLEENSRVCSSLHFEMEYISDKKINE